MTDPINQFNSSPRHIQNGVLYILLEATIMITMAFVDLYHGRYVWEFGPGASFAIEMILIVANFGDRAIDATVRIPQHALDCAGIAHGDCRATELLTLQAAHVTLTADTRMTLHADAHSAAIWSLKPYQHRQ